jgi:hypothetical protein
MGSPPDYFSKFLQVIFSHPIGMKGAKSLPCSPSCIANRRTTKTTLRQISIQEFPLDCQLSASSLLVGLLAFLIYTNNYRMLKGFMISGSIFGIFFAPILPSTGNCLF